MDEKALGKTRLSSGRQRAKRGAHPDILIKDLRRKDCRAEGTEQSEVPILNKRLINNSFTLH